MGEVDTGRLLLFPIQHGEGPPLACWVLLWQAHCIFLFMFSLPLLFLSFVLGVGDGKDRGRRIFFVKAVPLKGLHDNRSVEAGLKLHEAESVHGVGVLRRFLRNHPCALVACPRPKNMSKLPPSYIRRQPLHVESFAGIGWQILRSHSKMRVQALHSHLGG